MKTCPECGRNYPDEYSFCLDDGTTLSQLEGEKTQLLKGPFAPGGTTEQIPAEPGSEETVDPQRPAYEPAPTEPSPLRTIKSFEPLPTETSPTVEAAPKIPAPKTTLTVTLNWMLGTAFLATVVGLIIFFMDYEPSVASNTNRAANTANALQSRPITPNPNIAATSNTQAVASRPGQPLTAGGITEAETTEQEMLAHDKHGFIIWSVKPGDFVEQCGGGNLGMATRYNDVSSNGGSPEVKTTDAVTWSDPVVVLSLDVSNAGPYVSGQRLARLGKVQHMWVNANFQPSDAARLTRGLRVVFTDAGHTRDFNGAVDSIDARTGHVRIMLDDKDIFEPDNPKCLTIAPIVTGTVRFSR